MKKMFTAVMIIAVTALSVLTGCSGNNTPAQTAEAAVPETIKSSLGVLSYLNINEEEYAGINKGKSVDYLRKDEIVTMLVDEKAEKKSVRFYDTLDTLIMALQSGKVDHIELPESTADYVCAHNDKLQKNLTFNASAVGDEFGYRLVNRLSNGFSFMMTEENTALRDEFNRAIAEMKSDGTLGRLIKEYITDAADDNTQKAVEFYNVYDKTIKVAVTGLLPPMDYVSPDGTCSGFSTAVLSVIGQRIGKNIELIQVDSMGRAAALASGTADVVFWTRDASEDSEIRDKTEEEYERYIAESEKDLTEEQKEVMRELRGSISFTQERYMDIPKNTVTTQPYYNDALVVVTMK